MHQILISYLVWNVFLPKDSPKDLLVELEITQTMGFALIDGYRMHLTCSTSKSNNSAIAYVDMRWSGIGLRSLWVKQSDVNKQNDSIERKLFFEPWLDQHAGEYTCHLTVKVNNSHTATANNSHTVTVNKTYLLSGKCYNIIWLHYIISTKGIMGRSRKLLGKGHSALLLLVSECYITII